MIQIGKLLISDGGGGGGGATAANQTLQITQETQIATNTTGLAGCVDGNKLRVDILTSDLPAGAATALKQDTGNTSLTTLAGCVAGNELQVDVLSGGVTQFAGEDVLATTGTGTAMIGRDVGGVARLVATDTDGNLRMNILTNADTTKATAANQILQIAQETIIAVETTSLDAKKRALSNLGTNELGVVVTAGSSAVSASIDTANFGKWSVVCQDNSVNTLYFIIQQSWNGVTWFGDVSTGGAPVQGNALPIADANGTPTGFFYFNNSDGLIVDPGGFGASAIAQYARYIRIQAYDTGAGGGTFNVYWYQTNSA